MSGFGMAGNGNQQQQMQQQQQQLDSGAHQASGATVMEFNTQHEDNINDCQFDFYGT